MPIFEYFIKNLTEEKKSFGIFPCGLILYSFLLVTAFIILLVVAYIIAIAIG